MDVGAENLNSFLRTGYARRYGQDAVLQIHIRNNQWHTVKSFTEQGRGLTALT
jgi:hypothetical protein